MLCLVSTTGSCPMRLRLTPPTLCLTPTLASPLESAHPKNASVSPLESALAKSLDLKSPEINTYRKCGGSPLAFYNLHLFICVHQCFIGGCTSCLFCLPPCPRCLLATSLADRAYLCLG